MDFAGMCFYASACSEIFAKQVVQSSSTYLTGFNLPQCKLVVDSLTHPECPTQISQVALLTKAGSNM